MTVTNLPARRTCRPDITQYQPTAATPPQRRRRIGFIPLLLLAVPVVLFAGLMLNLSTA